MRVGGDCVKYLKRGGTEKSGRKDGRGNKNFKKRGQAGSRDGLLKKGVAGTPLRTMYR